MIITIQRNDYAPLNYRYYAFWGDSQDTADFWGSGESPEAAVRDLIDNYDIPEDRKPAYGPDFNGRVWS